jgi:hypothetical protein
VNAPERKVLLVGQTQSSDPNVEEFSPFGDSAGLVSSPQTTPTGALTIVVGQPE